MSSYAYLNNNNYEIMETFCKNVEDVSLPFLPIYFVIAHILMSNVELFSRMPLTEQQIVEICVWLNLGIISKWLEYFTIFFTFYLRNNVNSVEKQHRAVHHRY